MVELSSKFSYLDLERKRCKTTRDHEDEILESIPPIRTRITNLIRKRAHFPNAVEGIAIRHENNPNYSTLHEGTRYDLVAYGSRIFPKKKRLSSTQLICTTKVETIEDPVKVIITSDVYPFEDWSDWQNNEPHNRPSVKFTVDIEGIDYLIFFEGGEKQAQILDKETEGELLTLLPNSDQIKMLDEILRSAEESKITEFIQGEYTFETSK